MKSLFEILQEVEDKDAHKSCKKCAHEKKDHTNDGVCSICKKQKEQNPKGFVCPRFRYF